MFCEWGCLTYLVFAISLVSVKISKEEAQDKVGDCKAPTQLAFTCSNFTPCSSVSIVNFEHVIAGSFSSARDQFSN